MLFIIYHSFCLCINLLLDVCNEDSFFFFYKRWIQHMVCFRTILGLLFLLTFQRNANFLKVHCYLIFVFVKKTCESQKSRPDWEGKVWTEQYQLHKGLEENMIDSLDTKRAESKDIICCKMVNACYQNTYLKKLETLIDFFLLL